MQRWRTVALLAALAAIFSTPVRAAPECADLWEWLNTGCRRLVDTYKNGNNEVLVSGFAWHTPWTWTSERRAEENQYAWGGGWARSADRENGDTDTVYFLIFSDSHYEPEYNLGYAWTTWWRPRDSLQPGLGYTLMLISRQDIWGGVPFPAILPLVSLRYDKVTVFSTYIPTLNGGINHGSILYVFGRIAID
jgi:lipid IVA palmitoyltransferase